MSYAPQVHLAAGNKEQDGHNQRAGGRLRAVSSFLNHLVGHNPIRTHKVFNCAAEKASFRHTHVTQGNLCGVLPTCCNV